MMSNVPTKILLHQKSRTLELHFGTDLHKTLGAEFLRVNSPSAEVRGHGGQGGQLPLDKQDVGIEGIEVVGNYALKITFSDGHDSGLYSWEYLKGLCINQEKFWQAYLKQSSRIEK